MTGPRPEGTDWNALYGVNSPVDRREYAAGMDQINQYYDQFRRAEAARTAGPQAAAQVHATPAVPHQPASAAWTDEDLVGAATFWGLPEAAVRVMPKQQVIDFVNSKRQGAQQGQGPVASALAALAAVPQMFQVGGEEALMSGLQHLPGIGNWLSRQKVVHELDQQFRRTEESLRALAPGALQQFALSEANVGGNLASTFAPGAGAWAAAGKVAEVMPLVSRASPIGRALFQGGLSSYLLAGGTSDEEPSEERWKHRAEVVGLGALVGGVAAKIAPVEQALSGRVVHGFMPPPQAPGSPPLMDFDPVVPMNKAATIIQSPDFSEIAGHAQLGDLSVVQAAAASNPGGHSIVQGVQNPGEMAGILGENVRFVQSRVAKSRLDMIIGDQPLADHAALEYEKWGVFSGQRVHTAEGLAGTVRAVDQEGGAYVEPLNTGTLMHRSVESLHPSLESPGVIEAPELWDSFQNYTNRKAVETLGSMQAGITPEAADVVRTKNLATWMEDFLDQTGITRDGDRARVREYFNNRWVDSFRAEAPAEMAQQQAAFADLQGVVESHPQAPIDHLDQHAATKGFIAVPREGGKWTLADIVTRGDNRPVYRFDTESAAMDFLKGFDRDLPDITPIGEVPAELSAIHPTTPTQQPNTNEASIEALGKAVGRAEAEAGGPTGNHPPPQVDAAAGGYGRLQSRFQAAVDRFMPMRRYFSAMDQVGHENGLDHGLAVDFDRVDVAKNLYHTAMEPFQGELADLLAPVGRARLASGEWAQAYETLDPVARAQYVAERGWKPAEIASLDAYDGLMQKLFPETGLEEIRQIPQYFSHIAQRQSVPELLPRAFDDFNLGPTTSPFYEFARTGNLNMRQMDPRIVGDTYIRSVMWQKHMAEVYNELRDKWPKLLADNPSVAPMENLMGSYLDIIKGGYDPNDDLVLDTTHAALKKLVDPAITRAQAKEVVFGGLNSSYAGLIGYRPNMIARHFLQMTYAIPRAGDSMISVLGRFATSASERADILDTAIRDGAITPRTFTRAAPGAIRGEMERIGAGLEGVGAGGPVEPVEHTLRYNAAARVTTLVEDLLPNALKGHTDSVFQPMGAFSKAVERFRSIVYVSGKEKAQAAIEAYRAAGPMGDQDKLMGDSMMRTFDPSWQRHFQQLVGQGLDDEAAKFAGRQLTNATFFMYGTADAPQIAKSVTGKVALQLGHYELNYLQYLRETLQNGTTGDKVKFLATLGATTASLEAASRETGWNFRWLNPFFALGFGGGPMLGMLVAAGSGVQHAVKAAEGEGAQNVDLSRQGFTQAAGGSPLNLTPLGGLARAGAAIGGAQNSPNPGAALLRYGITGEVGPGPDINAELLPQAQAMFQRTLQPYQSPVRGGQVQGLPPGVAPQQFITDPAQLQNARDIPASTLPPNFSAGPASGVAPGGIEVFPRVNPQLIRR